MRLPFFLKSFKHRKLQVSILFTFCLLLLSTFLLVVRIAKAQVPPGTQECGDTAFPEFHTFRPYQANPCNDAAEDLALFCGNDLVITDNITAYRYNNPPWLRLLYCNRFSPTEEECFYRADRLLDLAIDVSGAEFPIMGNTEGIANNRGVVNSQDQTTPEQIDDAEKVNEYVSWYLNGVTNAAEYGALDPNDPNDLSKIVNLAGPIKKLLPHRKLRDYIEEAIDSRNSDRHDQVVGCVRNLLNPPWQWGRITECYPEGINKSQVRLSDFSSRRRRPPPEEDYSNPAAWWIAYQEWRGQRCISVLGVSICINDPTRPDYWGNLFFQIPLASTEDRKGLVEVVNPAVQPISPNMTVTVNNLTTTPADLFFAHQQESQKLADILQSTFTPEGQPKSGPVSAVSPAEYCDLTQVRSNPGDDLFAGEIGVNVDYTAEFSCAFDLNEPPDPVDTYQCDTYFGGRCYSDDYDCDRWNSNNSFTRCPSGTRCGYPSNSCDYDPPNQSCTVTAQVVLNTVTETPLTDDIWSRLVAGPMGIFKRIFPKVESGAPIEGILDIPVATGVNFNLVNPPVGVSLSAGNPSNQRSALELYFPHVGGIHEYFLKCIQQALRPQGFGEGCLSGAPSDQTTASCDSVPDSAISGTYLGAFKQNFMRLANTRIAGCTGPENNLAEECYNYVVSEASSEGVNPAFALTMWFNESGASNYCTSSQVYDFGIRNGAPPNDIVEQLSRFLVQPFRISSSCRNNPAWREPMEAFLSVFKGNDQCVTSFDDGNYYEEVLNSWNLVTEPSGWCGGGSSFGISWPTDSSCP